MARVTVIHGVKRTSRDQSSRRPSFATLKPLKSQHNRILYYYIQYTLHADRRCRVRHITRARIDFGPFFFLPLAPPPPRTRQFVFFLRAGNHEPETAEQSNYRRNYTKCRFRSVYTPVYRMRQKNNDQKYNVSRRFFFFCNVLYTILYTECIKLFLYILPKLYIFLILSIIIVVPAFPAAAIIRRLRPCATSDFRDANPEITTPRRRPTLRPRQRVRDLC